MNYVFNERLAPPFRYVHRQALKYVQELLSRPIPSEVLGIIVFGSSVKQTCRPDSDIDIYVLTEREDIEHLNEVIGKMQSLVVGIGKRFDILADTPRRMVEKSRRFGTVENRFWDSGVIVYEK